MRAAVLVLLIFNLALAGMLWLASVTAPEQAAVAVPNAHKIQIISLPSTTTVRARCMELGPFTAQEAMSARQILDEMSLGIPVFSLEMPLAALWWVFIAPHSSQAAAVQRAKGLEKLGFKGYHVFDGSSPWKHAISLGVFKSEEAAERFLEELKRKGIQGARTENRSTTQTMFYMNEDNAGLIARLTEIEAQFAGAGLRQVNCPSLRNADFGAGT